MSKTSKKESVIHDWVAELPFQMQALLMTAMRGPDACQKHNSAKIIVRYLRSVVLKPAGDWSGKNDNDFMWGEYIVNTSRAISKDSLPINYPLFEQYSEDFWNNHDEYPHHFIMHLVHCAEVVGYKHPDPEISRHWRHFYFEACKSFHMFPEGETQLDERMNDFGQGWHNNWINS